MSGDPTVTPTSGDATSSTGTTTGDTTGGTTTDGTTTGGTTTDGTTTDGTTTDGTTTGGTTTGTDPAVAPPPADSTTAPSAGQVQTLGDATTPPTPPETPPANQPGITMIGPIHPAALPVLCPAPLGPPAATGMTNLGLLSHRLLSTPLPGSGLSAGIGGLIEHVRDLVRQVKGTPAQARLGSDPSAPPMPAPAPPAPPTPAPAPPAPPARPGQSSGSSVSNGSHDDHKGGSSSAVLAGALLVLFLRPLALARLTHSSSYSRSFRPLVLPG